VPRPVRRIDSVLRDGSSSVGEMGPEAASECFDPAEPRLGGGVRTLRARRFRGKRARAEQYPRERRTQPDSRWGFGGWLRETTAQTTVAVARSAPQGARNRRPLTPRDRQRPSAYTPLFPSPATTLRRGLSPLETRLLGFSSSIINQVDTPDLFSVECINSISLYRNGEFSPRTPTKTEIRRASEIRV